MNRKAISLRNNLAKRTGWLIVAGLLAGCSHVPSDAPPLHTHEIHNQDVVSPLRVAVQAGDEVRWKNMRRQPVKIGLLSHLSGSGLSCNTGFTRFGMLDDTATVPPDGTVGLCFIRAGTIQYTMFGLMSPIRSEA